MGVVDEFVRQERVQHDLDGRIWRRRIDQVGALNGHQLFVGDGVDRAQLTQRRKPHRRQPFRLGGCHVGAGGFDPQHLDIVAEQVAGAGLQRGVAAAVEDELWIAAEKPRGVDAKRQVALDARLGAVGDNRLGVTVDPRAFHGVSRVRISRRRSAGTTSRCGAACQCFRFRRLR